VSELEDVERLLAIEAIRNLKAKYFRLADRIDEHGRLYAPRPETDPASNPAVAQMVNLFTDSATVDLRGAVPGVTDNDEFLFTGHEGVRTMLAGGAANAVRSFHHGFTPEIEIVSPMQARALWPMESRDEYGDDAPLRWIHSRGYYLETYQRVDGQWKIATLSVTKFWIDTEDNPDGSWD
jgi:SnoaL-like domain